MAVLVASVAAIIGPVTARAAVDPAPAVEPPASADAAASWQLVQSDDFNGSALDTSKWSVYGPWIPGHAGNGIRDGRAITVANGLLTITARMINGTLVSGGMSNRLDQKYGKFEFRVRTDADPTQATSGVVLTWPQSGRWPIDGENDIYETGTDPDRKPVASYIHYGSTNQQYWFHHSGVDGTQWHTFAMEWTPSSIKILRDGAVVWTVTNTTAIPDVAHHLSIQLDAFKSSMSGSVRLQVDWVKIYKMATSTGDTTGPVATVKAPTLPAGIPLENGRPTVRLRWTATDASSVARVEIDQSVDGGPYARIGTRTSPWLWDRVVPPGHTYRYRVRGIDSKGNVGAWAYSPKTRIGAVSQSGSSMDYDGSWMSSTSTVWWGGTARSSSKGGSTLTFTFTGRSIAWISLEAPDRGKASVYVDGVLRETVDLQASSILRQRVVWSANYPTLDTRRVTIRVAGTSGRPRVDVDGFIVVR
jgi:beta-glucanase (GH16 family)